MKKQHLPLVLFSAFFVLLSSCKKDDEVAPPTKTDFLVQTKWKTTALTINPAITLDNGTVTSNFYSLRNNCVNDDLKIFERAGIYKGDEGAAKCDPGDPQIFDLGNWSLSDEDTKLVINSANGFSSFNIQELTATSLIYTYSISTQNGQTYTFTETHVPQQ